MVDSRGWEGYWLEGTKFLGYKICPRDILYSLVPIVNNTVLFTQKFAQRVDLM